MYAKVFSQIYDGTLCTRGPWEALVTFQQLLVLADQEGTVDMTAGAIARRTTIPLEIIEKGIAVLLQDDPESRTPTENGKRILPVSEGRSWGWRIVNYKHYRSLKREEDRREYHREYWHKRHKASVEDASTQQTQHTQPNQPIAEAKAEAEAKAPPKAPKGAASTGFDNFWQAYPKKKDKETARKAWGKVPADLHPVVMGALARQSQSQDWTKEAGKYVPNAATWINGKRWEDEDGDTRTMDIWSGAM